MVLNFLSNKKTRTNGVGQGRAGRDRGIDARRPGQAWEVQHRGKEGPWAGGCSLGLVKMSSGSRFTASWDAAGTAQREGVARRGGSGGRRRGGFVRSRGFGSPSVAWIRREAGAGGARAGRVCGAPAARSWAGIGCWAGVGSKFGSLFFCRPACK